MKTKISKYLKTLYSITLTFHSELMDADAKILNLNFNGFKLKFSILIKQCDH